MKLAIPDLISNSYFPSVAAVELGFFQRESLDVTLDLMVPIEAAFEGMRRGTVDLVGGSAHLMVAGFPEWRGIKLICAQSQGMYWFLVMRADLGLKSGDLTGLRDVRIGAAPWVAMGLRRLLLQAGIDAHEDCIVIEPIPGAHGAGSNFGVIAAKALQDGRVDGFWANGMGAEIAIRAGTGTLVLDVRRGDGPAACFDYTMPALAVTDAFLAAHGDAAAAAVRAVARTHRALKADVDLAGKVGRALFPSAQAELIVDLVRRDLPYYDTVITPASISAMTQFSREAGVLKGYPSYTDIVAASMGEFWQSN